jgi:hypothetical protein
VEESPGWRALALTPPHVCASFFCRYIHAPSRSAEPFTRREYLSCHDNHHLYALHRALHRNGLWLQRLHLQNPPPCVNPVDVTALMLGTLERCAYPHMLQQSSASIGLMSCSRK